MLFLQKGEANVYKTNMQGTNSSCHANVFYQRFNLTFSNRTYFSLNINALYQLRNIGTSKQYPSTTKGNFFGKIRRAENN